MDDPSISTASVIAPRCAGSISRTGLGLAERLGRFAPAVAALRGREPIWIHAASVGEVLAAEPLVALLRQHEADHALMMTTTTVTGRQTAAEQLGVPATLLPVDLPWVIGRALRALQPAVIVIVETELWPSLFRAAARLDIPVVLVSARISERAAAAYAWIRPLMGAALRHVRAVAAQTEVDSRRLVDLGVPAERVQVLGSLKFARHDTRHELIEAPVGLGERPVLVAASTQPNEEEAVLDACQIVWAQHVRVLLVLAPRRPERFDEVAQLVARRGIPMMRRTQCPSVVSSDVRVFLLDTVGELPRFLAGAQAAFVGGTLAPLGGHNVLEPAVFGVPVCFGPYLDNVREAADALLGVRGAVQVSGAAELAAAWLDVMSHPHVGREMGQRARAELERRAAVAEKTLALVRSCLRRRA